MVGYRRGNIQPYTAREILEYETIELGNTLALCPVNPMYLERKATWVLPTKLDTNEYRHYGKLITVNYSIVIAYDLFGGMLVVED